MSTTLILIDRYTPENAALFETLRHHFPSLSLRWITNEREFVETLAATSWGLVVLDYALEWSDGLALLARIKQRFPGCSVIMYTASGSEQIAVAGMKQGLDDYLVKISGDSAPLLTTIRGVLAERKQALFGRPQDEARFSAIFNGAAIGIMLVDLQGRFCESNLALQRMLGYNESELRCMVFTQFTYPDDVAQEVQAFARLAAGNSDVYQIEKRFVRMDGHLFWGRLTLSLLRDPLGAPHLAIGMLEDINERKQVERALQESAETALALLNATHDMAMLVDTRGHILALNERCAEKAGKSVQELIGTSLFDRLVVGPDRRSAYLEQVIETGTPLRVEHREGDDYFFYSFYPVLDCTGKVSRLAIFVRDITRRKQAEEVLRESESRLAGILDLAIDAIISVDEDQKIILFNYGAEQIFGYRAEEVLGRPLDMLLPPRLAETHQRHIRAFATSSALSRKMAERREIIALRRDGTEFPAEASISKLHLRHERLFTVMLQDISERKAAEQRLAQQHEEIRRRLQENQAMDAISRALTETLDLSLIFPLIVEAAQQIIPKAERAVIQLLDEENQLLRVVATAGQEAAGEEELLLHFGEGISGRVLELGCAINSGDVSSDARYVSCASTPLRSLLVAPVQNSRRSLGTICVQSMTPQAFSDDDERLLTRLGLEAAIAIENARLFEIERRRAEEAEALQRVTQVVSSRLNSTELLNAIVAAVAEVAQYQFVAICSLESRSDEICVRAYHGMIPLDSVAWLLYSRQSAEEALRTGQPMLLRDIQGVPEYQGVAAKDISLIIIPVLHQPSLSYLLRVMSGPGRTLDDNDLRWLTAVGQQIRVALENAQLYSDLERALQQEQATRHQMIQAGKLSAMGKMVASVAHELNNPLQTIKNCLFLAQQELPAQAPIGNYLDMAMAESQRLSNLVTQLREVYQPSLASRFQRIALATLLDNVRSLVALHLEHNQVSWVQEAIPPQFGVNGVADQLKQVFINLSLNAADAMQPAGGVLTVRLRVTTDGSQVGILFEDTGQGIEAAHLPHLFDPFFTTKETGMGLGLSICYDIIQKHGGQIIVKSQLSVGSVFAVWLPLVLEDSPP